MKIPAKTNAKPAVNKTRRLLLLVIPSTAAVTIMIVVLFYTYFFRQNEPAGQKSPGSLSGKSHVKLMRENGNSLTRPLLLVVVDDESSQYSILKEKLTAIIHQWQQKNTIREVSVYLKDLNDASWMSIDADKQYMPGSLIKVPIMLYFLKEEEIHPGTLNLSLIFNKPKHYFPAQEFKGDSIIPGRNYKVSELLRYMIVESDNNATNLLSRQLKSDVFRKIFTDLDIPPDEINDINYVISPREYSRFFRVLYHATYLNPELSEYGLRLLSQCKFSDGIVKRIPAGTFVAHKFGERGVNEVIDFSESAIVYKGNTPYSLTIMTRGTSVGQQTELISELSDEVFKDFPGN